jgi:hypothetical protein
MIIENSGWSQERGWFCDKYEIDVTCTDHEIHWKNGTVCKQQMPFQYVTADWNNDDDIYSEFGANFDSKWGAGREWWTPQNLLSLMLDGEATIPGIRRI